MRSIFYKSIWITFVAFFGTVLNGQQLTSFSELELKVAPLNNSSSQVYVKSTDGTLKLRNINTIEIENLVGIQVGQDTMGGIVIHVYTGSDGQQHGLLISKIEAELAWQDPLSLCGSNSVFDGEYNTAQMVNSPAKDWIIANLGTDWYLPSFDEVWTITSNRYTVNEALSAGGHPTLKYEHYWTSTETVATSAYIFSEYSNIGLGAKVNDQLVRGFKKF